MAGEKYAHPSISLKETIHALRQDNRARMTLMEKKRTIGNRVMSYLSTNMMAIIFYRLSHYAFCKKMGLLAKLFYTLNIILFSCEITPSSVIGPGLVLVHVVGIGIHGKLGPNAVLYGQNSIGGSGAGHSDQGWLGGPIIGKNLTMGFGSKILTNAPIGNHVFVGAMSLVTKRVPDGGFMFGLPAELKRIRKIKKSES